MKMIQLVYVLNDDLGLKEIIFEWNDTPLPSNSDTLKKIAITTLKSIKLNEDSLAVQELLEELGIRRS